MGLTTLNIVTLGNGQEVSIRVVSGAASAKRMTAADEIAIGWNEENVRLHVH